MVMPCLLCSLRGSCTTPCSPARLLPPEVKSEVLSTVLLMGRRVPTKPTMTFLNQAARRASCWTGRCTASATTRWIFSGTSAGRQGPSVCGGVEADDDFLKPFGTEGILLDEALRGEHHLEVDFLRGVGRETKGHQRAEETASVKTGEGGEKRRGKARGLAASSEVLEHLANGTRVPMKPTTTSCWTRRCAVSATSRWRID